MTQKKSKFVYTVHCEISCVFDSICIIKIVRKSIQPVVFMNINVVFDYFTNSINAKLIQTSILLSVSIVFCFCGLSVNYSHSRSKHTQIHSFIHSHLRKTEG